MTYRITKIRVMRRRWWDAPVAYKYAVYAYLANW